MDKKKFLKILVLVIVSVFALKHFRPSHNSKSVKESSNYSNSPDLLEQGLLHGLDNIAKGVTSDIIYANQFPVRTGDSFINSPILQETNKMTLPDGVYVIEDEETYLRKQYQIHAAQNHVNILKIATATAIPPVLPAPFVTPKKPKYIIGGGGAPSASNVPSTASPSYNPFSPSFIAFNGGSPWKH